MDLNNFDVIISGWSGKMGLALRKLAPFYFSGKIYDYKSIEGISLNHPIWIDFSNQAVFPTIITQVGRLHCPLVMGTTGLKEEDWECLKDLSQQIPVFYDTNFSLGVHLLRKLVASMPQQISNFDVSILESHHSSKKDSPSGTAKALQADLSKIGIKNVPILSHRGGGIRGEHEIILAGDNEILTLKHEVLDRSVFAEGALKAAVWLLKQSKGLYNMEHFIS